MVMGDKSPKSKDKSSDKGQECMDRLMTTVTSLTADYDTVWGSLIKQTIKRVYPGFSEAYYGYSTFADLLEAAESAGLVKLEFDEGRGNYKVRAAK